MLFLIGTFGLNFPIFISSMSVTIFHGGANQYGLLTSVMAVGTLAGALLAAGRDKPRFGILPISAAIFGIGFALAAIMPNAWLFGVALAIIGVSGMTSVNAKSSLMQLSTPPVVRGRVMASRLAIGLGATPIGAPIIGWVADTLGPRCALGVGAASGFAAAAGVQFWGHQDRVDPSVAFNWKPHSIRVAEFRRVVSANAFRRAILGKELTRVQGSEVFLLRIVLQS
jgi:MFS family permease